jgi:hypothetical protein
MKNCCIINSLNICLQITIFRKLLSFPIICNFKVLLTATFVIILIQLPQQENLYDCGLFLLHYVELFLEEAPIDFSPFKITEFSNFVSDFVFFLVLHLLNYLLSWDFFYGDSSTCVTSSLRQDFLFRIHKYSLYS